MRLERRIREGTERNAGVLEPDIERSFSTVVREVRRRRRVRWALSTVVAVTVVAAAIVLAPGVLDILRVPRTPATGTVATQTTSLSPAGASGPPATFARTVSRGLAVVRANGLVGRWSIAIDTEGLVRLKAPAGFGGPVDSWQLNLGADELRTSVFAGDLCSGYQAGTYRWTRVSRYLILDTIHDQCDARVWLLTSGPWRSSVSA